MHNLLEISKSEFKSIILSSFDITDLESFHGSTSFLHWAWFGCSYPLKKYQRIRLSDFSWDSLIANWNNGLVSSSSTAFSLTIDFELNGSNTSLKRQIPYLKGCSQFEYGFKSSSKIFSRFRHGPTKGDHCRCIPYVLSKTLRYSQ